MSENLLNICKEIVCVYDIFGSGNNTVVNNLKYQKHTVSIHHNPRETRFMFHNLKLKNKKAAYIEYENTVVENCCICMEMCHTKSHCCHQPVCMNCIEKWKSRFATPVYSCPYCRKVYNKKDYHKITRKNICITIKDEQMKEINKNRLLILNNIKEPTKNCCLF